MASSDAEKWRQLVLKAKELLDRGQPRDSLELFRQAHAIKPTDKLIHRIKQIEVSESV